ncbi:MAG TPA: acyl carrier protein, partial [Anaeromyxobacteraceae bacterium]|nr:acyl carrier protein [Anaeromyxobacteraceae bacterium]
GAEAAVAREIVRIAREDLGFEGDPSGGGALASALDSLQLLSLVVAVEDRFRIVLADDDAAATRTLADLARLVVARADPRLLPEAEDDAVPGVAG